MGLGEEDEKESDALPPLRPFDTPLGDDEDLGPEDGLPGARPPGEAVESERVGLDDARPSAEELAIDVLSFLDDDETSPNPGTDDAEGFLDDHDADPDLGSEDEDGEDAGWTGSAAHPPEELDGEDDVALPDDDGDSVLDDAGEEGIEDDDHGIGSTMGTLSDDDDAFDGPSPTPDGDAPVGDDLEH